MGHNALPSGISPIVDSLDTTAYASALMPTFSIQSPTTFITLAHTPDVTAVVSRPTTTFITITSTDTKDKALPTTAQDDVEPSPILNVRLENSKVPGGYPYRELPKCYVECSDSEGSKTWPAIGDVRDISKDEFCHKHWAWVDAWITEHLQFCVAGGCQGCTDCHAEAGRHFDKNCPNPG